MKLLHLDSSIMGDGSASRAISSADRAEPDACPRRSPKIHDTWTTGSRRQSGHGVVVGRPWYEAACSRYGPASQASAWDVRPAATAATDARRASA